MSKAKKTKATNQEVTTEVQQPVNTAVTWTPRNVAPITQTSSEYPYFGTVGTDGKLLVYGNKEEGDKRRPQSKRVMNEATVKAILTGQLTPVPNGKHFDVSSLGEDGCPFRELYLSLAGQPAEA